MQPPRDDDSPEVRSTSPLISSACSSPSGGPIRGWLRVGCLLLAALLGIGATCAGPQSTGSESALVDPGNLQGQLRAFHKHMRWESFDTASSMVAESYREVFRGRYQEHGETYDIVNLDIKRVEPQGPSKARVEVEQKWYVEPAMTVEKERFVEIWARTEDGWMLEERLEKRKWRARQEERGDE